MACFYSAALAWNPTAVDRYFCDPEGDEIGRFQVPQEVLNKLGSALPNMGSGEPNAHEYRAQASVADSSAKFVDAVTNVIANDPTPGDDSPATPGGVVNDAGIFMLGLLPNTDNVVSFTATDSNNNPVVANIAIPYQHSLNPGIVSQGIRVIDGQTQVTVVGEGNALLSILVNPIAQATFQGKIESNIRQALWEISRK